MNGDGWANPRAGFTAAGAGANRIPGLAARRGRSQSAVRTGPGGGSARCFKSTGWARSSYAGRLVSLWSCWALWEQNRLLDSQMASRWPAVGASLRRRSLQNQERLEENEALQPVAGHLDTSSGALGSLCRQFQRRLPLRAVSLNLGVGPSWKRLETPEPGQQGLQAAARSAKSTLGAVSQRIQESCQSGTKWLVETQVKARRRKRGAQKGSSPPARSLSQRSTRLSVVAPAHSTLDPWEKEYHRLSVQMGPHAHPWRRSRREAAFRSPYSSAEPLCSPSESDSDLEPVGAGIRHLQKVSQELDEAIVAEDSGDMTVSLIRD